MDEVMILEVQNGPCYTLAKLLELQSKLILMCGRYERRRRSAVEAFVTVQIPVALYEFWSEIYLTHLSCFRCLSTFKGCQNVL